MNVGIKMHLKDVIIVCIVCMCIYNEMLPCGKSVYVVCHAHHLFHFSNSQSLALYCFILYSWHWLFCEFSLRWFCIPCDSLWRRSSNLCVSGMFASVFMGIIFNILNSFAHSNSQIGLSLTALIGDEVFFGKLLAVQETKFDVFHELEQ